MCPSIVRYDFELLFGIDRIPLPGPESIVEDSHGNLYSGLVNGTFIKIYPEKEIIGAGKIEMIAHIAFNKGFTTPLFKHGRPLG